MTDRTFAPWLRRRRALAIAAVLSIAAVTGPADAARQDPPDDNAAPAPMWQRVPDDRLSPGLIQLPVDSAAYRSAVRAWESAVSELGSVEAAIVRHEADLVTNDTRRAELRAHYDAAQRERTVALADLDISRRAIDHLAVRRYTRGGPGTEAIDLLLSPDPGGDVYSREVAEQFSDVQFEQNRERRERVAQLEADVAGTTESLVAVGTAIVETQAALEQARTRRDELHRLIPVREQAVPDRRMGATVADTDLTLVALDAYVKAAAQVGRERPACGIQWWMIAALGRIESRHGTIFGSEVRPDGRTSIRIIGIPLNGTNNTMRIADTDGGELDGDSTYDRAVGPMQFIPETWRSFRHDGNGDGVRDPHNLYDAAPAAAAYLCARGGDLSSVASLRAAYLAYNRSGEYVSTAIDNGVRYQRLSIPAG